MVTLRSASALDYVMPLKRPYGTARGTTRSTRNFIVRLYGVASDGRVIEGQGECQPRHALTGDGALRGSLAWNFLCAACEELRGRELDVTDRHRSVASVRSAMRELERLAKRHADSSNADKPFRGTLLGVEVALLDLAARALRVQIADVLGRWRDEIAISISTISTSTRLDAIASKVVRQRRYPITRVKGTGDVDRDVAILLKVAEANRSQGWDKPIWMDINEAASRMSAEDLIVRVADLMGSGQLPRRTILEGMLPKEEFLQLAALQRFADERCSGRDAASGFDLRVMPDEGLWDVGDVKALMAQGGCRAINLKAPKAGGLLASVDLVEAALEADPDVHVSIGGMLGTSDLTAFALHNLGRALPRLDYITATPPGNVEARIGKPRARYVSKDSNVIAAQVGDGLGTRVDDDALAPYVQAEFLYEGRVSVGPDLVGSRPEPAGRSGPHRSGERIQYTLVFGGDTSLGDKHHLAKGGGTRDRLLNDPMSFLRGLVPLVQNCDHLIVNFESVLEVDPRSDLADRKRYLGWDTPERTLACLSQLGVTAVGMANNHAMDYGPEVLLRTIARFESSGIRVFGAGEDAAAAVAPLTLPLAFGHEVRNVHVFAAKTPTLKLSEFGFFANNDAPGVARLRFTSMAKRVRQLKRDDPGSLVIVYPHWGSDYRWASPRLRNRGQTLIDAGADFVIGHGTHIMNDFTSDERGAIVWSLGNFQFNWAGRYDSMPEAVPYSLVARLSLTIEGDTWKPELRLYPTRCDNPEVGYQPRPVTEAEGADVIAVLNRKAAEAGQANHYALRKDEVGWYVAAKDEVSSAGAARARGSGIGSACVDHLVRKLSRRVSRGSSTYLLAKAALEAGLDLEVRDGGLQASLCSGQLLILIKRGTVLARRTGGRAFTKIDGEAVGTVSDKWLTRGLLRASGLSVAHGASFSADEKEEARAFSSTYGSTVIKPRDGNKGRAVSIGVTADTFDTAWDLAVAGMPSGVLIEEEFGGGLEARYLVIDGELNCVYLKAPPRVTGDGVSSIEELVKVKNAERRRNPHLANRPIVLDEFRLALLRRNGLCLASVPHAGQDVLLDVKSSISSGGETCDLTNEVHPSFRKVAERAFAAIPGLRFAGIDLIARNHGQPASESNYIIVEINTTPGLGGHHFPLHGTPRNPARAIIASVMRHGIHRSPSPVVASE